MNNDDKNNSSLPNGQVQLPDDDFLNDLSDEESGESSVSGSTAGVESDDDMLQNAHDVGLYTESNDDEAQPLNIADQIEKAEKYHRDH